MCISKFPLGLSLWLMHYLDVCCLISKYLENFPLFILSLVSSLIPLWSDNIICKIFSYFKFVDVCLYYGAGYDLFDECSLDTKKLCSLMLSEVLCWFQWDLIGWLYFQFFYIIADFMSRNSISCWGRGVAIIVDLSLLFYSSISFCFLYFVAVLFWSIHILGSSCLPDSLL